MYLEEFLRVLFSVVFKHPTRPSSIQLLRDKRPTTINYSGYRLQPAKTACRSVVTKYNTFFHYTLLDVQQTVDYHYPAKVSHSSPTPTVRRRIRLGPEEEKEQSDDKIRRQGTTFFAIVLTVADYQESTTTIQKRQRVPFASVFSSFKILSLLQRSTF